MRPTVCPVPAGLPLFEGDRLQEEHFHRPGTHPSVPDRVPSGGGHFGGGGGDCNGCCSDDG